jgi:hypothetical protein
VADEVGRRLAHALAQLNGAHEAAQMLQMRKGQGETGLQSAEGDEPWPAEHVPPMSEGSKHLAESWAEPSPESDPPAPPPVLGGAKMVYDTEPSGDPLLDLWNPAMGPPPVAVPRKRKPRTQRPAVAGSRGAGKQQ